MIEPRPLQSSCNKPHVNLLFEDMSLNANVVADIFLRCLIRMSALKLMRRIFVQHSVLLRVTQNRKDSHYTDSEHTNFFGNSGQP